MGSGFVAKEDMITQEEYMDMYIAVDEVMPVHRAQLLNYLRFAKQRRGILFNFGETNLHTERYLYLTSEDRFVMLNKDNIHLYVSR